MSTEPWWKHAVVYQVYPRSFADSNGDGIGDLPGVTSRLEHLARLGVDAIWLSPFYPSPQHDAGYDVANYRDVDPLFGTLADFDDLMSGANELGMRVIVDIVPNHSSWDHPDFKAALASPPGSAERAMYMFENGKGEHGELPPTNWSSVFHGPAWTRVTEADGKLGQWYLHLFDSSQPDWNWKNPAVHEDFKNTLRFWLDRGVAGFRVDVAHGMVKADGLPDWQGDLTSVMADPRANIHKPPFFNQPGVHDIIREWRKVINEYDGDRILVAEAWVDPLSLANYVRPDEMHQAFNFTYLKAKWDSAALRAAITTSIADNDTVGAPTTWVLSNHDVIRHASRLGFAIDVKLPDGIGATDEQPDRELGLQRARAATLLMLSLPGSAYLYQGEELGLPEVTDLPDDSRQDPTWERSGHTERGRDGCRVPIPWASNSPSFGFGPSSNSWLPQPAYFAEYAVDAQANEDGSTLELYRSALATRRQHDLGGGKIEWADDFAPGVAAFHNNGVLVVANTSAVAVSVPTELQAILSSTAVETGSLPGNSCCWYLSV